MISRTGLNNIVVLPAMLVVAVVALLCASGQPRAVSGFVHTINTTTGRNIASASAVFSTPLFDDNTSYDHGENTDSDTTTRSSSSSGGSSIDMDRRQAMQTSGAAAICFSLFGITASAAAVDVDVNSSLPFSRDQIAVARDQLKAVPDLIQKEQWDSVRALLVKPPLSDCWNKRQPLLQRYAELLGESEDGDELAALEAKEDAASHLRYLDMAVYNNVFNPIKSEGTSGATKELIRSYYEDPNSEYAASLKALQDLLDLSSSSK
jgi:hypothetical protein